MLDYLFIYLFIYYLLLQSAYFAEQKENEWVWKIWNYASVRGGGGGKKNAIFLTRVG